MPNIQYKLEETYEHFLVTPENARTIYDHMKNFWGARHNLTMTPEWKDNLLETYKRTIFEEYRDPLGVYILQIFNRRRVDKPFSLIELGCANGTALYYLKEKAKTGDISDVKFVGFEPYDLFCDDLRNNFENAVVVHGDAEDFIKADMSQYGEAPFSAFFSFRVFCMMPPEIVRACIEKAAALTDDILLDEYIMNFSGALHPNETVAFKYNENAGQTYFAHHFQSYFQDVGFDVVGLGEVPHAKDGKKGWAIIHAKRHGTW